MAADQLLFSYGTLLSSDVQLDMFGRVVETEPDVLPGYTLDQVEITDAAVVELSGESIHSIVRETGDPRDKIVGRTLWITVEELDASDQYEVPLYRRASVTLASGRRAWAYVAQ